MSKKVFPLFMGKPNAQIQIGEVTLHKEDDASLWVLFNIDVFPGERLVASRMVDWNQVLQISEMKYPREGNHEAQDDLDPAGDVADGATP